MNLHTILQRNNELTFNLLDNEVVMMNLERGEYYGLNPIGSRIWELLAEATTLENLINKLTEEFDVSFEQCQTDSEEFINDLIEKGLIKNLK